VSSKTPQNVNGDIPKLANDNISTIRELVPDVDRVISTGDVVFPILFVTEVI
jgi:hypothetical protein